MRSLQNTLFTAVIFFVAATTHAAEPVKHSFLGVGKANRVVIVNEADEVEWRFDKPASDG